MRTGERRRFASVRTELADYRQIHADRTSTVNDVVLAVVTGALRGWLLLRGEPVHQTTTLRAMVPLSVDDPNRVVPMFVDLPVGEPNPLVRLRQIAFATRADARPAKRSAREALVGAGRVRAADAACGGRPGGRRAVAPAVPAGGDECARSAASALRRPARLREIYPIVPVAPGQALAIGVTSYDGGVYFGLNADYEASPTSTAGRADRAVAGRAGRRQRHRRRRSAARAAPRRRSAGGRRPGPIVGAPEAVDGHRRRGAPPGRGGRSSSAAAACSATPG